MTPIDNSPQECFQVLPFKNAYAEEGRYDFVKSEMFLTEQEGIEAGKMAKENGKQVVRMQLVSYNTENQNRPTYEWKILEMPRMAKAVSYFIPRKNEALGLVLILVATFLIIRAMREE